MGNTSKQNTDPVWLRIKSLKTGERGEQTKLMKFCGLAQNTYNGWDAGTLKSYTKYVDKISAFYGVSADWILTGVDTEKLALDDAKRKLSLMLEENPSLPSGERLNFLFDEADYDPMIVSYNLNIDQAYIDSWLQHGILPPKPIVDKILGVFQMKASELLNDEEFASYVESAKISLSDIQKIAAADGLPIELVGNQDFVDKVNILLEHMKDMNEEELSSLVDYCLFLGSRRRTQSAVAPTKPPEGKE